MLKQLSQIFKERKGDEYVGGLTHYAEKIFHNKHWVGISIAIAFLFYRLLSMPVHTFHVFTAVGTVISTVTGHVASRTSVVYYVLALVIVISLAFIVFGGIKRVTRFTDKMVPVMAIGYTLMVLFLIAVNFNRIPDFFVAVFKGAFTPDAIFGGMFGVALIQGIKRGLLSNEAGMGTTSMAAASADTKHPCEQGFVQALSVFLDTFIICSMTGFVITMGAIWENPIYDWSTIKSSVIDVFAQSIAALMPGTAFDGFSIIFGCMAYACFAFTTLLGGISFCEISTSKLSTSNRATNLVRIVSCFIMVPLGCLCVLANLELGNMWSVSDLINAIFILINVPTILIGSKIAFAALKDYVKTNGKPFTSDRIGVKTSVWTKEFAESYKD